MITATYFYQLSLFLLLPGMVEVSQCCIVQEAGPNRAIPHAAWLEGSGIPGTTNQA